MDHRKAIKMGIGEAILRLVHIEVTYANSLGVSKELVTERNLIVDSLNQYKLDVGFDCDNDGIPDTVDIFHQVASTDCCRVIKKDSSRKGSRK